MKNLPVEKNSIINIALTINNKYSKQASVTIVSLLNNLSKDSFANIFIISNDINKKNKDKLLDLEKNNNCSLNFIKVDDSLNNLFIGVKTHGYISLNTYHRLILDQILPSDVNKVIYIDSDTLIFSDIKELYNTDISSFYLGAVLDIGAKKQLKKSKQNIDLFYFNAGVLLLNINKLRKENFHKQIIEYIEKNRDNIYLGDQQILNELTHNKVYPLDKKWNIQISKYSSRSYLTCRPGIIHFITDQKPWNISSMQLHKHTWLKHLQMTSFKIKNKKYIDKVYKYGDILSIITLFKNRPFTLFRLKFWECLLFDLKYYLKNLYSI